MDNFNAAVDYVLNCEGGLSDEEQDEGGLTKYGISARFLKTIPIERMRSYGMNYVDDDHLKQLIEDMQIETAKKIYEGEFWNGHGFESITSQNFCDRYFDCAVLSGLATATRFVQRAICSYLGDSEILVEDGVFGLKTLEKINFYGEQLIPSLRSERANFYRDIVLRQPSKEKFLKGWLRRACK